MANAPDSEDQPATPDESGAAPDHRLLEGLTSHALFRLDAEGAIATWPIPARNLYGYDSETVLGRQVSTLFADDKQDDPETADSFLDGVTVKVGPLDDGFYIEDDGAGIPENLRNDVFDHGITTADDGSGYGLSVVRTIVNAYGWDIDTIEAETGGARFEITGIEFLD